MDSEEAYKVYKVMAKSWRHWVWLDDLNETDNSAELEEQRLAKIKEAKLKSDEFKRQVGRKSKKDRWK